MEGQVIQDIADFIVRCKANWIKIIPGSRATFFSKDRVIFFAGQKKHALCEKYSSFHSLFDLVDLPG